MKLSHNCPTCAKPVSVTGEIALKKDSTNSAKFLYFYKCGHSETRAKLELTDAPTNVSEALNALVKFDVCYGKYRSYYADEISRKQAEGLVSWDGEVVAYDYQETGVKFAEATNFNCLIADGMGVGKTLQAIMTVKRNTLKLCPTLVLVNGSTTLQWYRQIKQLYKATMTSVIPIMSRVHIQPGFDFYVCSKDLFSKKDIRAKFNEIGIKCIILDEIQDWKDPSSNRTVALIEFITENQIQYKIALSGTPIKNRAIEYFTILNLLDPVHFNSRKQFVDKWLIGNEKGIPTRIAPWKLEEFRKLTSNYIIRREKHEVLTNLPPLRRDYQFVQIEDKALKQSYNAQLDLFDNFLKNTANIKSSEILGWLAKLRHITGIAKIPHALEFAQNYLDQTEDPLCIGFHHNGVRDNLKLVLSSKGYDPISVSGENDAYDKDYAIRMINSGRHRLLLLQMLSGGVGLNIQAISNALVLERCWSSADEEQFEARFHRNGQKNKVQITYLIAEGTIDHWFQEAMVTPKRMILNETLSEDKLDLSQDVNVSNLLRELAEQTVGARLK